VSANLSVTVQNPSSSLKPREKWT